MIKLLKNGTVPNILVTQAGQESTLKCALTLRSVFHLPLRATEGLIASLIAMMNLPIKSPDYSTFSRRKSNLNIDIKEKLSKGSIDLVIDSTGLKIYGEGEWKVRQHGHSKRRTWRKLHLGINPKTHSIEAAVVTTNDFKDNEVIEDLLNQAENSLQEICADGAYDTENCYQAIDACGAKAIIPPRKGAKIKQRAHPNRIPHPRDENLRAIRKSTRKQWKKNSGYHKRSLAETAMFRFKKIFGATLMSRTFDNQAVEALIKCRALNIMTGLGMPITVA